MKIQKIIQINIENEYPLEHLSRLSSLDYFLLTLCLWN
jgi:hypothetical protein